MVSRTTADRQAAFKRGLDAEEAAAALYRAEGFAIVASRARTAAGEIDLIAARDDLVVFIEVKRRKSLDGAAESLSPRQQQRIARAALVWLAENPGFADRDMRFDAVLLAPGGETRHIVDAFQADGLDMF
ncbi:MAG: YraN family protein [Rhodobiaceae bacterium]|nr:YraN family protein [Rhodobiaceae bacterium]